MNTANLTGTNLINFNSAEGINNGNVPGNIGTDILDAFGLGTQRRAQQFNSAEAQTQRNWEEYMSNTAYQRAVTDMQKAGLNPALMFGSGNAASTPNGANANSAGGIAGSLANTIIGVLNAVNTGKVLDMQSKKNNNIPKWLYFLK